MTRHDITTADRALAVAGVAKSFGSTRALIDVDLDVDAGELLALVGPSGCGKSTLLRIVAGLTAADRGRVSIGGRVVEDGARRADPEHRDVGMVFQEHALFPHLTVSQNIKFGLRALSRADRQRRADHWLATIGLPGAGDRYPHELSGGERQRVALARALAPQPRLMLLDEPFASLDPNLRAHIRSDVMHLLHETGTAAVFVTHDQTEALAIGDRIAVIRAGEIEQVGTSVDVFHRPVSRFVAGFMGEARFLPIDAATNMTELGPAGTPVSEHHLLVVRPRDVVVHVDHAPPHAVQAKVVDAEFLGATRAYELSLPSGAMVRSEQPYETVLHLGDTVYVTLSPGPHAAVSDAD